MFDMSWFSPVKERPNSQLIYMGLDEDRGFSQEVCPTQSAGREGRGEPWGGCI